MPTAKKRVVRKKTAAKRPAAKLSAVKVNKSLDVAKTKLTAAKTEYGKLITKSLASVQKNDTQAKAKQRAAEAQKKKFKKMRVTLAAKAKKSASKTTMNQLKKAKANYDSAAKDAAKIQAESVAIKKSIVQLKALQKKHAAFCKLLVKFEKDWAKKMAASKTKTRKKKRKKAAPKAA